MKKILALLSLALASCFVVPPEPDPEVSLEVQVIIIPLNPPGCLLSKVRIHDDAGGYYQARGCNDGVVTLAPGRGFGWVETLGIQTQGFSVYLSH